MLRWRLPFSVIVREARHFSRVGIAWIDRGTLDHYLKTLRRECYPRRILEWTAEH
jgi:hypothetical protein